jgi:hypothetical protein
MDFLSIRIVAQSVIALAGTHPEGLSCEATYSEKVALVQNSYCGFLPARRQYGELYLPFMDMEDGIGR